MFLQQSRIPSFSNKYLIHQACNNAVIRHVFHSKLKFIASERGNMHEINSIFSKYQSSYLELHNLLVSQGSVLEESDKLFAKTKRKYENFDLPDKNGTNACAFLALGITEKLLFLKEELDLATIGVICSNFIMEFPKKINLHRDILQMYDAYEAYELLKQNYILLMNFDFEEKLFMKNTIYSYSLQEELYQVLQNIGT